MRLHTLSLLLILLMAPIAVSAQTETDTYIGAGIGIGRSTADFDPVPVEFFGVGQKQFGRLALRGIGGIRTQPPLPLFQEGMAGAEQDGYEVFARPEVDFNALDFEAFKVFVAAGADFIYQVYPDEPGGKDNHYHSGLNPLAGAGVKFKAVGGSHRVAATRVFQEVKAREFPYVTAYKPGGRVIPLQHRGTLNPAYLEGWRLGYEYARPINGEFSILAAFEGNYYKFKNFPVKTFGDAYYQREGVLAFRVALLYH